MAEIKIDKELKSLIPSLTKEEYEGLEKSIITEGCRDAIVLWGNTIIDGHNRFEICTKNNVKYNTVQKEFADIDDVKIWMITNQFSRRNLTNFVRAELALKLKPLIAAKAKENQGIRTDLRQNSDKSVLPVDTKKEIAKSAHVSHDTIAKAEKIIEKGTEEQKAKLRSGDESINKVYNDVRKQEKVENVKKDIAEKKVVQPSIGFVDIYDTDKKYNIIYADPAWKYFESGHKNQSNHYVTMTIDEICNLPVEQLADDNCILFLWVTYPILQEAFEVIKAWGFDYSTCGFCWVKKNKIADSWFFGNGAWTRANSELCLIATKGSITRLDASISQIIDEPIDEHSRKPSSVREKITRLVGELPRIELFSRESVNGWDFWGNQV